MAYSGVPGERTINGAQAVMPYIKRATWEEALDTIAGLRRERDAWKARAERDRSALLGKLKTSIDALAPHAVLVHFDEPGTRTRAHGKVQIPDTADARPETETRRANV